MIKDEATHRVKSRKVLSTEASFYPRGVGVCDDPGMDMFNPMGICLNSVLLGVLWRFPCVGMIDH